MHHQLNPQHYRDLGREVEMDHHPSQCPDHSGGQPYQVQLASTSSKVLENSIFIRQASRAPFSPKTFETAIL
jgi:hypothetical protein